MYKASINLRTSIMLNINVMKKISSVFLLTCLIFLSSCQGTESAASSNEASTTSESTAGQSAVQDDESQKNVVQVAVGSKDHTTRFIILYCRLTSSRFASSTSFIG